VITTKDESLFALRLSAGSKSQTLTKVILDRFRRIANRVDVTEASCQRREGCDQLQAEARLVLARPPPFMLVIFTDPMSTRMDVTQILHNRVDLSSLALREEQDIYYEVSGIVAMREYIDDNDTAHHATISKVYLKGHGWLLTDGSSARMISQAEASATEPALRVVLLRLRTANEDEEHDEFEPPLDEELDDADEEGNPKKEPERHVERSDMYDEDKRSDDGQDHAMEDFNKW